MMLQKIEKYSRTSILQSNSPQSKAALQSCYFNLNNLQKMVQGSQDMGEQYPKNNVTVLKMVCPNTRLPQISALTVRNSNNCASPNNLSFGVQNSTNSQLKFSFRTEFSRSIKSAIQNTILSTGKKRPMLKNILEKTDNKSMEKMCIQNSQQRDREQEKAKKGNSMMKIRFKKKERNRLTLLRNQKYFQQSQVSLKTEVVDKIGLYEAANIYKASNVAKFLKEGYDQNFKPIINLKFATFSLCDRNQFFLTDNCNLPELQEADNYLQQIRKNCKPKAKALSSENQSDSCKQLAANDAVIQTLSEQSDANLSLENPNPKHIQWLVTIQEYQILKNEQYYGLKNNNIEDWSQINYIIYTICKYLKKIKISLLSFKFDKSLFMKQLWSCKRIPDKVLQRLLKIKITIGNQERQNYKSVRIFKDKSEIIRQLMSVWRARQQLISMKRKKQKEKERIIWTAIRMTAKHKMMLAKKKRSIRTQTLNEKLRNGDWDHQIEIHIPSFSESQFVRNTTQYMQHYENMFYHMWKSSNKQFILIIPAINETLLRLFQQKIKLNKNITLICPESHQLYPKTLPLSASLLYSKEALYKIKKILEDKKGIIIPGKQLNNRFFYEEHLSDILNCPIFSTLNIPNNLGYHKQFWQKYQISTAKFTIIDPNSLITNVIEKLSQLIFQFPKIKVWLFKINKEFNGRGIAKFDADSSKKIKQILSLVESNQQGKETEIKEQKINQKRKKQIKDMLIAYLEIHFRLKLKINFENCIFRVEQYIQTFLEKGGIIEEYLQGHETYEMCYKLEPGYSNYSHLYILDEIDEQKYICCAQNYEVDFVTKATVFLHDNIPKGVKQLSKKIEKCLKSEKYMGYISVTVLFCPKNSITFAVEIKPYMTINSSMSYMLKIFGQKKGANLTTNRRLGGIVSNVNIQSLAEITGSEPPNTKLLFLFIPCIIFTDVDEETRSQIIQNLVVATWEKVSTKLFEQPIVAHNPDTFHGTLYLSLGLTLGILLYGKPFDLKRMKSKAIECVRELADKSELAKLYRGKQEARDVFQFGDLIRAITKIKS